MRTNALVLSKESEFHAITCKQLMLRTELLPRSLILLTPKHKEGSDRDRELQINLILFLLKNEIVRHHCFLLKLLVHQKEACQEITQPFNLHHLLTKVQEVTYLEIIQI